MEKDYISYWYKARVAAGGSDVIRLGLVNQKGDPVGPGIQEVRHQDCDGYGAVCDYLQHQGIAFENARFTKREKPAGLDFWKLVFRKSLTDVAPISWRYCYPENVLSTQDEGSRSDPIAVHVFTRSQTQLIVNQCTEKAESLSVLLLHSIHQVVNQYLLNQVGGSEEYCWMFPVNMRGSFEDDDHRMNRTSAVFVPLSTDDSIPVATKKIQEKLKKNEHWSLWFLGNIGKLIGQKGVQWLYDLSSRRQVLGSCTYLGEWYGDRKSYPDGEDPALIITGLGSDQYPVTPTSIMWNDRLSLTLKVNHSVLPDNSERAKTIVNKCMNAWVKKLVYYSFIDQDSRQRAIQLQGTGT